MKIVKVTKRNIEDKGVAHYNVHLVGLDDGTQGIWKGDKAYFSPPVTTLKEVIAHRIDRWLGLHVIPETDFYQFEGKPGALQRYVGVESGTKALAVGKPAINFGWAQKLGLYDYIVNSCDRWHCNMRVGADGRLWGIDNCGILQTRDAWSASAWAITGVALPEELKAIVLKTRENMKDLVKMIFNVQFESREGIVTGQILNNGINIMCEKITTLAGALGYEQPLYDTWGCPSYDKLKREILECQNQPES